MPELIPLKRAKGRRLRDALTASDIAQLMQPQCPQLSRADLELCAQHLLNGIYEGIQRGAQIWIADPLPDGGVEIGRFVIEKTGQGGRS